MVYKSLNRYLCVDDLPNAIYLHGTTCNVLFGELFDSEANLVENFPFMRQLSALAL